MDSAEGRGRPWSVVDGCGVRGGLRRRVSLAAVDELGHGAPPPHHMVGEVVREHVPARDWRARSLIGSTLGERQEQLDNQKGCDERG